MNDTRVGNARNADLGRSDRIVFDVPGAVDRPTFIGNIAVTSRS